MNKILFLVFYRLKSAITNLKNIFFGILLLSLSLGTFSFFMIQTKIITPKLLICNEDRSAESKLLMAAVINDRIETVVETQRVDYETGKRLLKKGEASAMLHVKENTIPSLYEGELTTIHLYVSDTRNDFNKMLIDYFNALAEVINVTQTTGLIYMDGLYSLGYDYSQRMEKFSDMQTDYIKSMFLRDRIFHSRDNIGLFNFMDVRIYYYSFLIILIFGLDYLIKSNSLTSKEELRLRLKISGYDDRTIQQSDHIVVVMLTSGIGMIADHLALFLGGNAGWRISIQNALLLIALAVCARITGRLLQMLFKSKRGLGAASFITYSILFLMSGLIVPSYYLGKAFIKMNQYNPLTMLHQILTVNRMM